MDERIQALADRISKETLAETSKRYPDAPSDWAVKDSTAHIHEGTKYTKIDVGGSGKYMVDQVGNIYGIKAYGVIHRGHQYGTLDTIDDWYWGGYVAVRKPARRAA